MPAQTPRPEWSDFRVLLALSRAGSVAGAARELLVDQSTISRRLAALEEAAGAKLLIRGGREFSWTNEGRAVLQAAEAMENAVEAAMRTVRTSKVEVEGAVRVSVAPAFAHILMRGMMPVLRETHPQLGVTIEGAFARADLAKGEADIALRMMRPEDPDLVARKAFDLNWFSFASRDYLEANGTPATPEDLHKHAVIAYAEFLHSAPPMRWMESYKAKARASTRVDSVETACQAAAADAGIVLLPAFVGDSQPNLSRVFAGALAANVGWVVYHACLRDNARVRVVADALIEYFRTHEALMLGQASAV